MVDKYLSWCQFMIYSGKNKNFIHELTSESVSLIMTLLRYLEDYDKKIEKNRDEIEKVKRVKDIIKRIIILYTGLEQVPDSRSKVTINSIHSVFWQFTKFDLKKVILSDKKFLSDIYDMMSKTTLDIS